MDFDELVIRIYCLFDDVLAGALAGRRLRQRGPAPISDRSMAWSVADRTDGDLIGDRS